MIAMLLAGLVLALAPFGHDHYVSRDAGWCWFADPRAIWVNGRIVSGGVTTSGDVVVCDYDPVTKLSRVSTLASKFQRDDHNNPSFLKLPNGQIAAFFSKHTGPDLWMATAQTSGAALQWSTPWKISPNDPTYKGVGSTSRGYTYPNPQLLANEQNRIYLFWRGLNWKPTMSWSDDLGKTWSPGKIFVSPADESPSNRPYMKVAGDGKQRIHFAFTDGHPRNEPANSIYYAKYENGALRTINGNVIAGLNRLPIRPDQADVVYDGKAEGARAWIWDVATTQTSSPVIVYSRLPSEDKHVYRYATWNGRRWVDRHIVDAGKWFPQTPEGQREREPHYSGGVTIDPNDPRVVYLSRPIEGRFEIERWFTPDGGDTWSHVAITGNSKHDSIRPFVVRGNRPVTGPAVVWVNASKYIHYTDYISTQQAADEDRGPWSAADPRRTMRAVWRWARSNPGRGPSVGWTEAPLYSGLLDYAELDHNEEARAWVRAIGETKAWKLGPRPFMADDHAVGQGYLQLYKIDKKPEQIAAVRAGIDAFATKSHDESLEWKGGIHDREWAWCDALYMGPPTLAMLATATGDRKYLELMNRLWWKTSDYLLDPAENLFYRDSRYFTAREANGKKVFWSRGNGWVLAGLARVLAEIPKGDPLRPKLESQFKAMAERIASLQTPDGTWHSSLLDPASYPVPETSGTGFFCYALAWGMRDGLLDRDRFMPVVDKAFASLTKSVDLNGRLGWVQPVGADPKGVLFSDTDAYGVGAFLLAGTQIAKLHGK